MVQGNECGGPDDPEARSPTVTAAAGNLLHIIEPEPSAERSDLVPLFDRQVEAPVRCCLITAADSRRNPGVQAFREWILKES